MKLFKKIIPFSLLVMGLFLLSACSTTGKQAGAAGGPEVVNANEAGGAADNSQTQGLGSEAAFGGGAGITSQCMAELSNDANAKHYYFFSFNQDSLKSDKAQAYMASLQQEANYLVAHPNAKIKLVGNADDRGSREYNKGLAWRRATTVEKVLQQYGAGQGQLDLVSNGAEKPVAQWWQAGDANDRNMDAWWQCNRRVDLITE